MPAQRRNRQSRRLTTAGLIAVSAATILMMAWAIFPTAAFAGSGTQQDPFGPGDKVDICHYDGSDTGGGSGKYNQPNPSVTGTGPAGHIGHEFDVIPSYYFQQNENAPVEFFAGVNWPTLTHLPSSPVDYTPLIGSSAAAFIAGGCAEPSPCPSGTSTVTSTATETTTTTQTFTTIVTAGPPESLAGADKIQSSDTAGDGALTVEDECTTTVPTTTTITSTIPTTTTTTVPFCPNGSETTTVTSTAPPVTSTVTVGDQPLQVAPECTTTETTVTTPTETTTVTTSPPPTCPNGTTATTTTTVPADTTSTVTDTVTTTVTDTTTTTITVGPAPASGAAAAQADVLQAECEATSTVTTTPTVTSHTTTTVTDSTTETETTTTGASVGPTTIEPTTPDEVNPTTVTPGGTAFTGVENVVPMGAVALFLMSAGSGLLWAGARRRRQDTEDAE